MSIDFSEGFVAAGAESLLPKDAMVRPAYTKTSPSQIETFRRCKSRWYFGSILRLPQPQSPEAEKGEAMHREIEKWELEGVEPTHPSCKLAIALPDLVDSIANEAILIEWNTTKCADPTTIAGVILNGRVDRLDARDTDYPLVWDWKSKGKKLKGMTKAALAKDPQLISYAKAALGILPQAKGVRLAHCYIGRDEETPYAKPVITDPIDRADVDARFNELAPTVEEMAALSQVSDPQSIPKNTDDCWAFGSRCPFYDTCKPHPLTPEKEEAMSLLEKLKANAGAASIPSPTPSTSATPVPEVGAASSTAPASVLTVYIDAMPEKGVTEFTRLEDEISKRCEAIAKAHGVKTIYEKPLDFGKGRDALVESFRTNPPKGVVVAKSAGLYSAAILEVLTPLAPVVWRGF